MSARYRVRQGLRALGTWLHPADDTLAQQHLSPALFALFEQMRRSERQHSLRVLSELIASGHDQPDLLAAALLHDVGKIRAPFSLPEKVLVVLVKAISPGLYLHWGTGSSQGWRRPFAVSVQHPIWGADMVAEAGGTPLTVELIRRHANALDGPAQTEADRLLLALQAIDGRN
jgi:hypothetical protein